MLIKMLGLNLASSIQLHYLWFSIKYVLYFNVLGSIIQCNSKPIPKVKKYLRLSDPIWSLAPGWMTPCINEQDSSN